MLHKCRNSILFRFRKKSLVDRIIFDDVYEVSGNLAIEPDEFVGVLPAVVEIFEEDIFEGDLVAGLLIKIVQRIDESLDIIGLVDGHDLVALLIVSCMQRNGQLELDLVVTQLSDE